MSARDKASPHSQPMNKGECTDCESTPSLTKVHDISPEEAYETAEASRQYKEAKEFLNEGKFEKALECVENGIEAVKGDLPESAMAPFHYLYGTTLLYQLEESTDTNMTVSTETTDEDADDMQIAWENLEAARIILETTVSLSLKDPTKTKVKKKFEIDLAQIALREGDLQRMNGRYNEAIQDYQTCLELRKLHLEKYDRKIADALYNLGLSNLLACTELQKGSTDLKKNTEFASHEDRSRKHCEIGVDLYLECAKTLCGRIASRCGKRPSEILGVTNCKTTTTLAHTEQPKASKKSETLRGWRFAVSSLTPSMADDQESMDLLQLLDEIQETVDEAEKSQYAIRQAREEVTKLKSEADNGKASVVGFDKPTMPTARVVDLAGENAKSVMVIRKKKKRDNTDVSKSMTVAKKPKPE